MTLRMRFNNPHGVNGLTFHKATAGWLITRYDASMDGTDVIAGAFPSVDLAVDAARNILTKELAALEGQLLSEQKSSESE